MSTENKTYYYYNTDKKTIHTAKLLNYVSDSEIHILDEYLPLDEVALVIVSKDQLFEDSRSAIDYALNYIREVKNQSVENLLIYTGEGVEGLLHFAMVQDSNNILVLEVIRRRCIELGIDTKMLMTYHFDF